MNLVYYPDEILSKAATPIDVENPQVDLVQLKEESNPPALYRYNRYISATVGADLSDGYTLGKGIEAMDEISSQVLDETFSTALTGASKDFKESS